MNRLSRWGFGALAAVMMTGLSAGGCRVNENDIQRWETTQRGPDKLMAVITHDKYEVPLRVQAALALVRMKPRGGRRVGIPSMVSAVAQLGPEMRRQVVGGMIPTLVQQMSAPAPVLQPGQPLVPDTSVPYKDAAFALLSYDKDVLVIDEQQRRTLTEALANWTVADFEHRYDNATQMFGLEQVIRFLGAPGAKLLPRLITPESRKIPELAKLIAENGDGPTKEEASKQLVEVAKFTSSQAWLDRLKPIVEEANKAAKLKPTPAQFNAQLSAAQDEQLKRVFGAMRKVGGRAVVEYSLAYAADKVNSDERRRLALASLEGNFDQNNPEDVKKILALAQADDVPDKVRDLALHRVGEMPRDRVIAKLYDIFGNKRWQVRWVAAGYAIKMSNTTNIPEFFANLSKLPKGGAENFALTEALSYGDWMGNSSKMPEKEGKKARDQILPFLHDGSVAARTTALGYFYTYGTKDDLGLLASFESDKTKTPKCDDKQTECEWKCFVPKANKPDEKEAKQVTTVGEYVKDCIEPAIRDRAAGAVTTHKEAETHEPQD